MTLQELLEAELIVAGEISYCRCQKHYEPGKVREGIKATAHHMLTELALIGYYNGQ